MAATVAQGTFIAGNGGDHPASAVQTKLRFAVDQQQLLAGCSAPWIPSRTCSQDMVNVMKGTNPGQVRMPQTLNEIRQPLRAGQHEQSVGPLQGISGEVRQVRQQWAGIGRRKSDDGMASRLSGSTYPCRPATAD